MQFLNANALLLAVVFSTCALVSYGQTSTRQNGYVWTFSMRDGGKNELTQNLTTEFEGILVQSNTITVLNRTKFATLLEQREMEKSVQELDDLPESAINTLKTIKADLVLFGEVYVEKPSNLARITITLQNFDSKISNNISQDCRLDQLNESIIYREVQLKKLVNNINKSMTGNNNREVKNIWHRTTYRKGFGIEIYPYVYEFLAPGLRVSYFPGKRWGAGIGLLTEEFDGVYIWGGFSYDLLNDLHEEWSLYVGPNIGIADLSSVFGFADIKVRYKILTASFGIGYNNVTSSMIAPFSVGVHLPIE